ncbi:UvrD-helicase domain-containing protein [Micromonospora sp. C95]|uniref:HelD family protein n=1 Tax=Micromonospora sp. C95 TaxID=2824882 RepID=UPI001B36278E|nr:UvrD-helicase domain-containing protein [Micromonospora sp. C95]MBQ1027478.1 UvrD-helicase domain-containing protein [Micromonospora sp. C95]
MTVDPDELKREQDYFDAAWEHRERMRTSLGSAAGAAANSGAAVRIRRDTQARQDKLGEPDEAVAFARMDDESGERLYLGYHAIFDDESNIVVVNWQAPAATRYHKATHTDPCGLRLKRDFTSKNNTIQSFTDVLLADLSAEIAELESWERPSDTLLNELGRNRTGSMQDIVRTIQAAQFDLIQTPLEGVMVVQGGPGTGKTAIALHRVSWLLFNYRHQLTAEKVLVIGPNPTFTRYTRMVLPTLGDTSVVQLDVHQLHPPVRKGGVELADVARLKGDQRMASLVERALYARVGLPGNDRHLRIAVDRHRFMLPAHDITAVIARARDSAGSYSERRQLFRQLLPENMFDLLAKDGSNGFREISAAGLRQALDPLMDRIWPSATPAALLRELYSSRDRLIAAAGDEFTAREVSLLHRRAADKLSDEQWTNADLAVLDEAEHLINSVQGHFEHIVVDETQDLSPMQLRSIARRSANGSFTVVGDIAQSTGKWARDEWDDVVRHLSSHMPVNYEELRYGYRVPRQVFEFAAKLLPIAAPSVKAPQVVREGPADPSIHHVHEGERAGEAVRVAMGHAAHGRSVAIICPDTCREDIELALIAKDVAWRAASEGELGPGINVVDPHEAKGLEFDAVVVVEPADIVADDVRGHRLLYVALTRTTRYLDVICIGDPLPDVDVESDRAGEAEVLPDDNEPDPWGPVLDAIEAKLAEKEPKPFKDRCSDTPTDPAPAATAARTKASERVITAAAEDVVELLRESVVPNLWQAVLAKSAEIIADRPGQK